MLPLRSPDSWTCLLYLDDIIVFAATWEEHLARLRQVFESLCHAQLKLSAEKCTFAAKEVSYLGHLVTSESLLPDPTLLAAIREIAPLKYATEVGSFLGLAGYYRRYVKNFAAIAGPLHGLTRKEAIFHWGPECQDAFDHLKTLLTTSPITAFPDFSLPFRLYTDASTAGLGAILAQVREGKERNICCASRSLNQAEKAYPATKLECLAIVWAVAKFRPYLMSMSIRGLYRPLRAAVAQDDAHRICPPSSMVSRPGRIRFYRKTPAWEVTNPRRWTQPLTCRPASSRRCHPANTAAGG